MGESLEKLRSLPGRKGAHRPIRLKRALQGLMWEKVGPLRNGDGLNEALKEIGNIRANTNDLNISMVKHLNTEVADAIELSHMLAAAAAIVLAALERKESRGAHVREDFPERDDESPVTNVLIGMDSGNCKCRRLEAGK